MTAELKSSDEILQELFGMCKKKSIDSSEESSQSESDVDDDASSKKHKKKKKKHKKNKKRSRSSSVESESSDRKSHKRKKKKSHKDEDKNKKLKVKIKTEPGEPKLPYDDLEGIVKNDDVMDTTTGKKMTIDDVFNSLGILPKAKIKIEKGITPAEIKQENGRDVKPNLIPEGPALPAPAPPPPPPSSAPAPVSSPDKVQLKVEKDADINPNSSTKTNLYDVFDAEPNLLAEKNTSKTKKINIDNLKNSSVYEATIKEVEERERQKAEKYEEGELSSSSSSSQDELSDNNSLQQENEPDSKKKEKRRHKHKHRSKSKDHERSKSKHRSRSHHRKHSHEKTSHKEKDKEHKSRKSSVSPSRHSRSSKSHYDYHHHSIHHRQHYSYHSRASSAEGRGSSRSHASREVKRDTSNDRIHSRTRGKMTSKERKSRSKSTEKIDKQKLLEIARKNAITLLKKGALPASVVVNTKDKIASIKAGGKTVDELTDFCKQLSKKDAEGQESLSSGSDLDEEREKAFHHPFQLKERPSSIVMNIRNAVPLPTKTAQEKTLELSKQLSLQYPVSSGQHHRTSESEWVPVEKTPDPPLPTVPPAAVPPPPKITGSEPSYALNYPLVSYPTVNYNGYSNQIPLPQASNVDIGSIVAERLEAIRRLTENPSDPIGNDLIQVAESKMKVWAESKVQPGLFTGSTGVRTLSAAELSSGFKAWPKKNQFIVAKPVVSDKGEALMKKMGWQPGEGLGKYKQGPPEPCEIAMKTDRKGLAEQPAVTSFQQNNFMKRAFELSQNKHPVSLLNEYCSRKKIGTPQYDCEEKDGAGKRKLFLFSVTVKGMKYTPHMPCCNKKQSKIEAATLCLQNLGLLPTG